MDRSWFEFIAYIWYRGVFWEFDHDHHISAVSARGPLAGAQLVIWLEGGYEEIFRAKREKFFGPPLNIFRGGQE